MTYQEYNALIREARRAKLAHDREAVQGIRKLLEKRHEQIVETIASTPQGTFAERYQQALLTSIDEAIDQFSREYKTLLDERISSAADLAMTAERRLYDAAVPSPTVNVIFGTVARNVLERAYLRTYRDGLTLSDSLHKLSAKAKQQLHATVMEGIAKGESSRNLAKRIEPLIKRKGVDNLRYRAMRIARTEINTAYREGQLAAVTTPDGELKSYVRAIGWRLSPAHPRPDICDVWASQDIDGVGSGNYLPENIPAGHPNCLCHLVTLLHALPDVEFVQYTPQPAKVKPGQNRYYGVND